MDTAGTSEAALQFCQTIRRQIAQDILSCSCDRHASTTFALSDPPTHHVCRATDHIAVNLVTCRWKHAVSVLTFVNRWHLSCLLVWVCAAERRPVDSPVCDISLNLSLQIDNKETGERYVMWSDAPLASRLSTVFGTHGRQAYWKRT